MGTVSLASVSARNKYAVSPNIGQTIASARQGIIDTLCCLDWLGQKGYKEFGIVGTSLGFGHAFVASALDQRLRVNVFNHCCSIVSDAIWAGMPNLRAALESHISQQELRECWSVINPITYFNQFVRFPKKQPWPRVRPLPRMKMGAILATRL
jgi:hypothetical protein